MSILLFYESWAILAKPVGKYIYYCPQAGAFKTI